VGQILEFGERDIGRVFGAAAAAASDRAAAEQATLRAFEAGGERARSTGERLDPDWLAATAVRLAVRAAPHDAFAPMDPADREAVALARLLGWREDRIAAELGVEVIDVRRRLVAGLRAALPEAVCA
jgi:DNA-directed RNA polymerase specialized sigma24 family protein